MGINGENYNPGGGRVEMSQLLGVLKFIVMGMVIYGFNPWSQMGLGSTPGIVTWAFENKIYACLMTFFLCNMIETQLISSGAFEVSVNGETVWSKLEMGNPPQPQQLLNLVKEKLTNHREASTEDLNFHDQI